jgi:hypothetical protein
MHLHAVVPVLGEDHYPLKEKKKILQGDHQHGNFEIRAQRPKSISFVLTRDAFPKSKIRGRYFYFFCIFSLPLIFLPLLLLLYLLLPFLLYLLLLLKGIIATIHAQV